MQKPSIADVLEFQGAKMECAVESTPHEETRIYSSILEGGNLMQKFEESESQDTQADDEAPRSGLSDQVGRKVCCFH